MSEKEKDVHGDLAGDILGEFNEAEQRAGGKGRPALQPRQAPAADLNTPKDKDSDKDKGKDAKNKKGAKDLEFTDEEPPENKAIPATKSGEGYKIKWKGGTIISQ